MQTNEEDDWFIETGIVRSYVWRFPAWKSVPVRRRQGQKKAEKVGGEDEESSWSTFQLFNQPMKMEEEFDRYSQPSTQATEKDNKVIEGTRDESASLSSRKLLPFDTHTVVFALQKSSVYLAFLLLLSALGPPFFDDRRSRSIVLSQNLSPVHCWRKLFLYFTVLEQTKNNFNSRLQLPCRV